MHNFLTVAMPTNPSRAKYVEPPWSHKILNILNNELILNNEKNYMKEIKTFIEVVYRDLTCISK